MFFSHIIWAENWGGGQNTYQLKLLNVLKEKVLQTLELDFFLVFQMWARIFFSQKSGTEKLFSRKIPSRPPPPVITFKMVASLEYTTGFGF